MHHPMFNYSQAFRRNLGWITEAEQLRLRYATVAIGGMGGVGGHYLFALARLGVGKFRIADYDHFGLANFNRQAGATLATVNLSKCDTMAAMAQAINPTAKIEIYGQGLSDNVLNDFFEGVDIYIDGLDFFAFDIREKTFAACAELRIPAITAAPLGMGVAWLCFMPGEMDFKTYFRWKNHHNSEKALLFLAGLAPSLMHRYLADPRQVNFEKGAGPSTAMACYLCAGIAATEAIKVLLGRGKLTYAPHGLHFDAYLGKFKRTWLPMGNTNPIQKIMRAVLSSWERVHFLNRYIGAAWTTSLSLDGWTALACGAHMIMLCNQKPQTDDDFIDIGKAVQRVWLTATKLHLWQQPEMTIPIFARYVSENVAFTTLTDQRQEAASVRHKLEKIIDTDTDRVVWGGRLGFGPTPTARALRLPLEKLIIPRPSV
jgi:molybdopterin/thiamine biosynthesis adenylyltransferase